MPRSARKISSTGIYHVMARGSSRQLVFEDDIDRRHFLALLSEQADKLAVEVLAYCLMENHVHLLLRDLQGNLSPAMKNLLAAYATWFNLRHGRCGHLFQGRFKSEAVESEDYLLVVVRYIHENPAKAGMAKVDEWRWSSFREYAEEPSLVRTDLVLGIVGGKPGFHALHEGGLRSGPTLEIAEAPKRLSDEEALALACKILGGSAVRTLKGADRRARNEGLRKLKQEGLGVRQIQRLTGISLSVISRA